MRRPLRVLLNAPAGPRIVCLESELDDAAPPEAATGVDLNILVHKPSVS
jgi:hypothetical protein